MSFAQNPRQYILRFLYIGVAAIILLRLFALQIFEDKYKIMANDIAIYRKIVYPPRGVIYDRKDRVMLYNQVVYDLMVTTSNVPKNFDTLKFCEVLGIDKPSFDKLLKRVHIKSGPMRQGAFLEQLTPEQTARYQENMYRFPCFEMLERSIRTYPNASAGLILGYVGEVSPAMLKSERYASYNQGDYVGMNGLESSYEEVLRGQRGVHFLERDNYNRPRDPYKGGALDTPEIAGRSLQLYLDAELQQYAEKLMVNKIGSVVAIDPKTGGIITMVSSPSYDPNLLRGRERSKNFSKLYKDATHPLFNRATQAAYQPGSTIKPMTALVALDVGVINAKYGFPCGGGYGYCGRHIACTHSGGGHAANLRLALANSCNAYFCHIFRLSADAKKYGDVKAGLEKWHEYFWNFGYGHPTGVDIPYEGKGLLPDSNYYNDRYNGVWNSCTVVFVGMGQGELALTPLQLANSMCIVANKGYYYTPHFVKSINNNPKDPQLKPYLEKHKVTNISDSTFEVVQLGMQDVVDKGTGRVAQMEGVEICAKTGTVENYAIIHGNRMKMQNHSVFVAFAPRKDPKIAIAVIVENAGFGSTWAGPVASLLIEKYLTDSIKVNRKHLEDKLYNAKLISKYTYIIDSAQRLKDKLRWEAKMAEKKYGDSMKLAIDTKRAEMWLRKHYMKK
ncbi:MAG TPA: penicillin-binding protein 2 [Flavipsychrobacter sp.]|nr:penicillin-binding protein 2 [Flavipsychrobacter sp.]